MRIINKLIKILLVIFLMDFQFFFLFHQYLGNAAFSSTKKFMYKISQYVCPSLSSALRRYVQVLWFSTCDQQLKEQPKLGKRYKLQGMGRLRKEQEQRQPRVQRLRGRLPHGSQRLRYTRMHRELRMPLEPPELRPRSNCRRRERIPKQYIILVLQY